MNEVLKVATLGGDGTGPEVVGEAVKVLNKMESQVTPMILPS